MEERKYYLTAIPEGDIANRGRQLQEEFSQDYGIYREPYPPLHMTVGIISFPLAEKEAVRAALQEAIAPYLPLELLTLGESCFPDPYKSINLSIEKTEKLTALSGAVREAVEELGFTADPLEDWDYHISLVNCNYALREWSEEEYREACRRLSKERLLLTGTAHRLELWDPLFPPLTVIAEFRN